jgi:hypothetical protein
VNTEDISIAESEITIAQDSKTGAFRLIVVSHDGRTVLSQYRTSSHILHTLMLPSTIGGRYSWRVNHLIVARDFMGSGNSGPNFRSLTWVIQINEHGRLKQRRYQNGFEYIVLSDICGMSFQHEAVENIIYWQVEISTRNIPTVGAQPIARIS